MDGGDKFGFANWESAEDTSANPTHQPIECDYGKADFHN